MSVITEIAMFPLGHEHGIGKYVKRIITIIQESGYSYSLTSMGTIIETENLQQALQIIQKAYDALAPDSNRVYCTAKFDIAKSGTNRMEQKIHSVRKKL